MIESLLEIATHREVAPPRVLAFVGYYLPGYKGGGPTRTIANMVENLGSDLDFLILTYDRDLNDRDSFSGINVNEWQRVGKALVYYASPEQTGLRSIARLLRKTPHDILYLNSFFSPRVAVLPLLLNYLHLCPPRPIVIAPRGEFSEGALALKALKKRCYIEATRLAGMHRNLTWQASSERERHDILRVLRPIGSKILVAPNLSAHVPSAYSNNGEVAFARAPGPLRIVFLSRISPMKNLDYLLRVLQQVTACVELNIYGPTEDLRYWNNCQVLMNTMPLNVRIAYRGPVTPTEVPGILRANDVFLFPTRGENFGHVIIEALHAGTSVIISDQTPWDADPEGACQVIPLSNIGDYVHCVQQYAAFTDIQFACRRRAAVEYARRHDAKFKSSLEANRHLFFHVLEHSHGPAT